MKPQPHEEVVPAGSTLPSAGLAACILAMAFVPFAYIAIGALSAFAPGFSLVTVPLLLLCGGYLFYRMLAKPTLPADLRIVPRIGEVVGWGLIAGFVTVVSSFNLLTKFERVGLTCTIFLICFVIALPIVSMRETVVRDRVRRMPKVMVSLWLLAILISAAATTTVFFLRPPSFP
jgi:hypothetical protein